MGHFQLDHFAAQIATNCSKGGAQSGCKDNKPILVHLLLRLILKDYMNKINFLPFGRLVAGQGYGPVIT